MASTSEQVLPVSKPHQFRALFDTEIPKFQAIAEVFNFLFNLINFFFFNFFFFNIDLFIFNNREVIFKLPLMDYY